MYILDLNNVTKQINHLATHLYSKYQGNVVYNIDTPPSNVNYIANIVNNTNNIIGNNQYFSKDVIRPIFYCIGKIKEYNHKNYIDTYQKYNCFFLDNVQMYYSNKLYPEPILSFLFLFSCMFGFLLCYSYKKKKENDKINVIDVNEIKTDKLSNV